MKQSLVRRCVSLPLFPPHSSSDMPFPCKHPIVLPPFPFFCFISFSSSISLPLKQPPPLTFPSLRHLLSRHRRNPVHHRPTPLLFAFSPLLFILFYLFYLYFLLFYLFFLLIIFLLLIFVLYFSFLFCFRFLPWLFFWLCFILVLFSFILSIFYSDYYFIICVWLFVLSVSLLIGIMITRL